jgi:hypothetical protein
MVGTAARVGVVVTLGVLLASVVIDGRRLLGAGSADDLCDKLMKAIADDPLLNETDYDCTGVRSQPLLAEGGIPKKVLCSGFACSVLASTSQTDALRRPCRTSTRNWGRKRLSGNSLDGRGRVERVQPVHEKRVSSFTRMGSLAPN